MMQEDLSFVLDPHWKLVGKCLPQVLCANEVCASLTRASRHQLSYPCTVWVCTYTGVVSCCEGALTRLSKGPQDTERSILIEGLPSKGPQGTESCTTEAPKTSVNTISKNYCR